MFTYLLTGSFGEYFLFYGLADFILYMALAWRHRFFFLSKILSTFFTRTLGIRSRVFSRWPHLQNSSSPGVWHETPFTATSVPKLIFFTLISADGWGGYFLFEILANYLASFFFPVERLLRTTICPVSPFFIHPVTECKHLLTFTLTHILYLLRQACRSWPTLLYFSFNGQSLAAC